MSLTEIIFALISGREGKGGPDYSLCCRHQHIAPNTLRHQAACCHWSILHFCADHNFHHPLWQIQWYLQPYRCMMMTSHFDCFLCDSLLVLLINHVSIVFFCSALRGLCEQPKAHWLLLQPYRWFLVSVVSGIMFLG